LIWGCGGATPLGDQGEREGNGEREREEGKEGRREKRVWVKTSVNHNLS